MPALKPPKFWFIDQPSWESYALSPFSRIWDFVTHHRKNKAPDFIAPIAVISVGSPIIGGSGKTPSALWLADGLKQRGFKPAILSRGYGGRYSRKNMEKAHLVDPKQDDAADIGDEPLMMARHDLQGTHPIFIHPKRDLSAKAALAMGADCLIMDDGRTNASLYKDIHLITLDGTQGLGNGKIIPAGPLREDGQKALSSADYILLIGEDKSHLSHYLNPYFTNKLYHGEYRMTKSTTTKMGALKNKPLIIFSAIANGNKFYQFLTHQGFHITAFHDYPDHHPYSLKDENFLIAQANRLNATLVTTAKDAVKLSPSMVDKITIIDIHLNVEKEATFFQNITAHIIAIQKEKAQ